MLTVQLLKRWPSVVTSCQALRFKSLLQGLVLLVEASSGYGNSCLDSPWRVKASLWTNLPNEAIDALVLILSSATQAFLEKLPLSQPKVHWLDDFEDCLR